LFRFVARFARVRIEDSSFNRFALNGIQRDFFGGIFPGGFLSGGFYPDTPQMSKTEDMTITKIYTGACNGHFRHRVGAAFSCKPLLQFDASKFDSIQTFGFD